MWSLRLVALSASLWLDMSAALSAVFSSIAAIRGSDLHKVNLDQFPLAVCLDGSPGAFYFWPGRQTTKWYIHYTGGGWCSMNASDSANGYDSMVDNCGVRSAWAKGSSNDQAYASSQETGWTLWGARETMSDDVRMNPAMHDWNKVSIVYCDGFSFSGRILQPIDADGRKLFFRGGFISDAVKETLLGEYGLQDATDVVIGGDSAGALAALLHVDQWRSALPPSAFVASLPDSGVFLDWSSSKPDNAVLTYAQQLRESFRYFNASQSVNANCVSARVAEGGDQADCMFAEHLAKFIETPIFALQSTFDVWQRINELGTWDDALFNIYHSRSVEVMHDIMSFGSTRGGFIDRCPRHVGYWQLTFARDGLNGATAFQTWYDYQRRSWVAGVEPDSLVWYQEDEPPSLCAGIDLEVHVSNGLFSYMPIVKNNRSGKNSQHVYR